MAKILIVDDDPQIRKMLPRIFEGQGHDVEVAENGARGLEVMSSKSIDLVVSDVLMPVKDGLEMIRDVKRSYPDMKIIAMSGGGSLHKNEYLKFASVMGAQKTLSKPIVNTELIQMVDELLQ